MTAADLGTGLGELGVDIGADEGTAGAVAPWMTGVAACFMASIATWLARINVHTTPPSSPFPVPHLRIIQLLPGISRTRGREDAKPSVIYRDKHIKNALNVFSCLPAPPRCCVLLLFDV